MKSRVALLFASWAVVITAQDPGRPLQLPESFPQRPPTPTFRSGVVRAFSDNVAHHTSYVNIIVVTHGGVIKAYLNSAGLDDPMGPRSYEADNCSVTHIQFMGSDTADDRGGEIWSVACFRILNQVEHLRDEDSAVDGELVAASRADLALQ